MLVESTKSELLCTTGVNVKMIQSLWETMLNFPKKLKIGKPCKTLMLGKIEGKKKRVTEMR